MSVRNNAKNGGVRKCVIVVVEKKSTLIVVVDVIPFGKEKFTVPGGMDVASVVDDIDDCIKVTVWNI